ncbi:hypothetical protein [Hufsiella ginkgonis]|uniref:hypothetical protein n=1 Tax=Hufsiella ginkgonis TaxID=2695274 RepID=UPI001925D2DF|nr:hypothetical protein [Hufsiella ginkgonis]
MSNEVYVWPSPDGKARGQAIIPLYPNQVFAVKQDETLYNLLSLIDTIRVGKVRESEKAVQLMKEILSGEYT